VSGLASSVALPGTSLANTNVLRPLSGSRSISAFVTVLEITFEVTSSTGVTPFTCTSSLSDPGCRRTRRSVVRDDSTLTLENTAV